MTGDHNFRRLGFFLLLACLQLLNACTMETREERTTAEVKPLDVLPLTYDKKHLTDQWGKCDTDSSAFCARIDLAYPLFSGGQPAVAAVNEAIRRMITTDVLYDSATYDSIPAFSDAFLQQYREQLKDFPDSFGWMYTVKGSVPRNDSSVVALRIERDLYTGGAHGMYQVLLKNIDPQSGKTLTLQDVLSEGYEQTLNEAARQAFMKSKGFTSEEQVRENGFNFENERYYNDNFLILPNNLKFYFNGYDIAAYAAGPSEFTVPLSSLSGYLQPGIAGKSL